MFRTPIKGKRRGRARGSNAPSPKEAKDGSTTILLLISSSSSDNEFMISQRTGGDGGKAQEKRKKEKGEIGATSALNPQTSKKCCSFGEATKLPESSKPKDLNHILELA